MTMRGFPMTAVYVLVFLAFGAVGVSAQQVPQRLELTPVSEEPLAPAGEDAEPRLFQLALNKAHVVEFTTPISNIVLGNEGIADVYVEPSNPNRVFLIARAIGSTNVFFMDADNRILDQAEIRVLIDADGLREAVDRLLPNEEIDVSIYGANVFLTGAVSSTNVSRHAVEIAQRFVPEADAVSNLMRVVGSQQVILQVKVAEIDRITRKNLSASGNFVLDNSSDAFDLNITTSAPSPTLSNFGTGTLLLDKLSQNIGPVTLGALERQSLVKTLAEPTLTALSGETATFLSGGETPVPVAFDEQNNITVGFREFGVRLSFTPLIEDKGRINLNIVTEISSISTTNQVIMGLSQITT